MYCSNHTISVLFRCCNGVLIPPLLRMTQATWSIEAWPLKLNDLDQSLIDNFVPIISNPFLHTHTHTCQSLIDNFVPIISNPFLHTHTHICVCVCVCMYIQVHTFVYRMIYTCTYRYTHIFDISMWMHVYTSTHTRVSYDKVPIPQMKKTYLHHIVPDIGR